MSRRWITFLVAALMILPLWGCGSSRDSASTTTTASTPEAIARATAFVGADRCGGCHETKHTGWEATGHTMKLRDGSLESNFINDGDINARADFFGSTEFNLQTQASASAAFAAFGSAAPILGNDAGKPYVKLGTTKYYISFTLGGNGKDTNSDGLVLNAESKWKQRYITKIGLSNYILPVQFNAKTQKYVVYDESKWYDSSKVLLTGTVPPTKNNSYERRCAGCHVTGLTVALVGDEWTMSYSDISVSCEACHGPGGQHATSPNKDNIVNPASMTTTLDLNADGNVDQKDNLLIRNYVCYRCHSRGAGKHTEGGTTLAYPSKTGSDGKAELYLPGLDWKEYYDISEKTSDYYGGTPTSNDFLVSASHHQQQQDLDYGPHSPDKNEHECFVCHDMHDATNDSMVVTELVENGITVPIDMSIPASTNNSRSKLCLTCHAGTGDFSSLTVGDVRNNATAVTDAVKDHANEMAVMGHDDANCTDCHMPKTAKSAIKVTDSSGTVIRGDIASHTLRIIWPSQSVQFPGLPNSCSNCHNADTKFTAASPTPGTDQILAWAKSGHGNETSDAWKHYDWDEGDAATTAGSRQACQRCHTATGANNYLKNPTGYDQTANEFFLGKGKNQVLYCYGCHNGNDTAILTPGAITVDYKDSAGAQVIFPDAGDSNVCISCHAGRNNGQNIKGNAALLTKNFGSANSHYLAAAGTLFKTTGYEYASLNYANSGFEHDTIGLTAAGTGTHGPCAACHMHDAADGSGANHRFTPFTLDANGDPIDDTPATICTVCHNGTEEPAWTPTLFAAQADGFASAITALTDKLALSSIYYNSAAYPYFYNTNVTGDQTFGNAYTTWADEQTLGAAFNLNLMNREPGAFAHNSDYARRLLFDSIDWIVNGSLTGTIDLSAYPEAADWYQEDGNTANDNVVARP
ncbi:MAG: hypothetical protein L3J63_05275 [Geopsychrobacter sp.]|nr:hypothetical protein [Geopsychrobacter sp.]